MRMSDWSSDVCSSDLKGVQLKLELETLPAIDADRELLFEAICNLVSNAFKFTPVGGTIWLRARTDGDGARLCVLDNGPGIPAGERDAVLQRFYRSEATRQLQGSGLGLHIDFALVRLQDRDGVALGTECAERV